MIYLKFSFYFFIGFGKKLLTGEIKCTIKNVNDTINLCYLQRIKYEKEYTHKCNDWFIVK